MKCIQRNSDEYRDLLNQADGNKLLADNAIYTYWTENESADKHGAFPPPVWMESFMAASREDINNLLGKSNDNLSEEEKRMNDFFELSTSGEPDDEAVEPDKPYEVDIKYTTEEAAGIAGLLRKDLSFTPHRGESNMPTGITSLFDKEVYDPRDGAIVHKETPNTHAGSLIHKLLEQALNEADPDWGALARKYHLVKMDDDAMIRIANKVFNIADSIHRNFDVIATELPIKVNVDGQERHGFVDLVVRNKWDGKIGIIDYKTSAEDDYVTNTKFMKMADNTSKERGTKWDKLQEQTLAYQLTMNDTVRKSASSTERYVDYRAFMPISLDMSKDGNLKDLNMPVVHDLDKVVPDIYLLKNTAYHMDTVKNALGIELDFDPDRPLAFENQVREVQGLLSRISNEWIQMKLPQRALDIKPFISGLNILGEPDKTLMGLDKYIDTSMKSVMEAAETDRTDIIQKVGSDIDIMSRPIATLSTFDREAMGSLLLNVHEVDPDRVKEHVDAMENLVFNLKNKFDRLNAEMTKARAMVVRNELDSPETTTNLYLQFAQDQYFKEQMAKKRAEIPGGRDIRLYDHEQELKQSFAEVIQNPQNRYASSINRIKDAIVGIGSASDIALDQARTLLANLSGRSIPLFSKLGPAKNIAHPIGRMIIHKLDTAWKSMIDRTQQEHDTITDLAKGVFKVAKTRFPRKAYDFMIDVRTDAQGNQGVYCISEIDWDKWETYKQANLLNKIENMPKLDRWGRANPDIAREMYEFERKTMQIKDPNDILKSDRGLIEWDAAINPLHRTNQWARVKEGQLSPRDAEFVAARHAAKKLTKLVSELADQKKINQAQLREANYHIHNMKTLQELTPARATDDVLQIYNYLNDALGQVKSNVLLTPEQFRSDKYKQLMSLDDNDPRKLFYEHYLEVKEMYDMIVPEVKRLGDNLPSVYRSKREQGIAIMPVRRDRLADDYRKNVGDRGGWLIGKKMFSKPWQDKWLNSREDWEMMHRAWEYGSSIPLPYSGYPIDPNDRSYDMGYTLFKLASSFERYKAFAPVVPEMELLHDTWQKNAPTMIKKSKVQEVVGQDEIDKTRKVMDYMVYGKDNSGKLANVLSNYSAIVAFPLLAYKTWLAAKSHVMSGTSLRALAYYSRPGEFSQKALFRTNMQHVIDVAPHIYEAATGKAVTKGTKALNYFNLQTGDRILYEGILGSNKPTNVFSRAAQAYYEHGYDLLWLTDTIHLNTALQTYMREKHVYDVNGKDLGNMWDNFKEYDKGQLSLNPKVNFMNPERTVAYSKENVQRTIEEIIGSTTSVKNPLDRPIAAMDKFDKLYILIKTIGLNGMAEWFANPHFDEKRGIVTMGPFRQFLGQGASQSWRALGGKLFGFTKLADMFDRVITANKFKGTYGHRSATSDLTSEEMGRINAVAFALRYVTAFTLMGWLMSGNESPDEKKNRLNPVNNKDYWMENAALVMGNAIESQLSPIGIGKAALEAYSFDIALSPIKNSIQFGAQVLKDAYLMSQGQDAEKFTTGFNKDKYRSIELAKKLLPYYGNDRSLFHPELTLKYQEIKR
jgi:hypothetical protein